MKALPFILSAVAAVGFAGALLAWNSSQQDPTLETMYKTEMTEYTQQRDADAVRLCQLMECAQAGN